MTSATPALRTLESLTSSTVTNLTRGNVDLLDTLGALRLVELAAERARRAVVAQARAEGITWQELADTLAVSRQAVQQRYGTTRDTP